MKSPFLLVLIGMVLTVNAAAQDVATAPKSAKAPAKGTAKRPSRDSKSSAEAQHRKFVVDVVNSAVALPQPDPQDRLCVLYAAANVIGPLDSKRAAQFAREGTRIEGELVSQGQRPVVSMLAGGHVDCAAAVNFVQTIPPTAVLDAEQSLLGAITACPRQAIDVAKRKLEAGLQQGSVASRPILALMQADGMQSAWSQSIFSSLFASLPEDGAGLVKEAPDYAALFVEAASKMDKDSVKTAGLKFLLWLGKLPDFPERNAALNMTTGSLADVLGKDGYEELLQSDVMARQATSMAGQSGEMAPVEEESVSVLQAMSNKDDRTSELQSMPASLRAREAAASGFASGTSGDRKAADHYFDIAYSSLDEVWSSRSKLPVNASAVVEEVSQAAAQVDAVEALQRSQRLQDPSAEAISMLAVARTVAAKQ